MFDGFRSLEFVDSWTACLSLRFLNSTYQSVKEKFISNFLFVIISVSRKLNKSSVHCSSNAKWTFWRLQQRKLHLDLKGSRGEFSSLQQLYSEQPSKNGSNKNIAKGTMDLGVDCFDRFWMYCILCIFCILFIFCIFWTVPVYNSILMQVFHHVRHFLHHGSRLPLREELLSAHQGNKGQQTSQYLIKLFHLRILSNSSPPFINSNTRYTCISEGINNKLKIETFWNTFRLCPGPKQHRTEHK